MRLKPVLLTVVLAALAVAFPLGAASAAQPKARLTFRFSVPAEHVATTTVTTARPLVGQKTKAVCAVHSRGPNTVTKLHVRIAAQTTRRAAWTVRLGSPSGRIVPAGGGALVAIGTLAPGQTKLVTLYVQAHAVRNQLTLVCNVDQPDGETIIEPPFDRAGDYGVALRFTAHH